MSIIPKKSLGQNFLTSQSALNKIILSADITASETILEIGPGKGVLTRALLDKDAHVIAVEKDHRLIPILGITFEPEIRSGKLLLLEGDALDIESIISKIESRTSYKIVANIPYYITGAFIRTYLSTKRQPTKMVILVQKEVARRIVAHDKKESILSVSVKVYGQPKIVTIVPRGSFTPAPNVDSAVLEIDEISKSFFVDFSEDDFFDVLKRGFSHKRKLLCRNLQIEPSVLVGLGIDPKARAEDIELANWKSLAQNLKNPTHLTHGRGLKGLLL